VKRELLKRIKRGSPDVRLTVTPAAMNRRLTMLRASTWRWRSTVVRKAIRGKIAEVAKAKLLVMPSRVNT
jgi:hypothetical protein